MIHPGSAHALEVKACPPERLGAPASEEDQRLSVFADLLGDWKGEGYNLIPLPVNDSSPQVDIFSNVFRLEAQKYQDELTFELVGCVPNRGNGIKPGIGKVDQFAKAIEYHQKVTVTKDGLVTPIHEENGMLLVLEPDSTTAPDEFTVARLASVPHGNSILAMGKHAAITEGPPTFAAIDSRPIKNGTPDTNSAYLAPYKSANAGLDLPRGAVQNPNLILEEAVANGEKSGRHIVQTATVELSTNNDGHISNVPFLADANANLDVPSMDFVIWIEQVVDENTGQKLSQLQYSQNTLLDFNGLQWPHIDLSTLVKQ